MDVTITLKLYYLGKDDKNAIIVFIDSKDDFIYTVRPIKDKEKIIEFSLNKDEFYAVTYSPDAISDNPKFYELKSIFNPVTNKSLLF